MYTVIYRYKVSSNIRKRYLELMRKTADLYAKHGCLGHEVLEDAQHKGHWLEINRFRNKAHYQKVHGAVDEDPKLKLSGGNSAPSQEQRRNHSSKTSTNCE